MPRAIRVPLKASFLVSGDILFFILAWLQPNRRRYAYPLFSREIGFLIISQKVERARPRNFGVKQTFAKYGSCKIFVGFHREMRSWWPLKVGTLRRRQSKSWSPIGPKFLQHKVCIIVWVACNFHDFSSLFYEAIPILVSHRCTRKRAVVWCRFLGKCTWVPRDDAHCNFDENCARIWPYITS